MLDHARNIGGAKATPDWEPGNYPICNPRMIGSMRVAALALLLVLGCSPTASAPAAPAEAAVPPSTAPEQTATPEPEATPAPAPAPPEEEPNPVAVRINAKYDAANDAGQWAKRFERKGREVHDQRAEVLEALAIAPGSVAADVGVGSGLYTLAFADAVGPEGTVFAVDVQDYFLDHVRTKAKDAKAENITFVKANQRSVNLEPNSADLVFMCDVFHHVEYPRTYLASLFTALRPGGRFAVIDFIAEEGKSEAWVLEHVRASPAEFQAEFEAAGFVLETQPDVLEENFFHIYRKPE